MTAPHPQRAEELSEIRKVRWAGHVLNNGFIFGATYHGVSQLPVRLSYAIGKFGTWLAYKGMSEGPGAVMNNLRGVFPTFSEERLSDLALLTYRSYAFDTIDFIRSLSRPAEELGSSIMNLDRSVFDRLLSRGNGILLVAAHFGSWELGAVLIRKLLGYPLTVVAMPEPSRQVNRIRTHMRTSLGMELIEVRQSIETPLQIRRKLSENRIVAMLVDRFVGRDQVAVRFCGQSAYFLKTPAMLSYLTGAPMLPAWVIRHPDGRFQCLFDEPVYTRQDSDRDRAIGEATQTLAEGLESKIREYPHLWYQFYPFWESQKAATDPTGD